MREFLTPSPTQCTNQLQSRFWPWQKNWNAWQPHPWCRWSNSSPISNTHQEPAWKQPNVWKHNKMMCIVHHLQYCHHSCAFSLPFPWMYYQQYYMVWTHDEAQSTQNNRSRPVTTYELELNLATQEKTWVYNMAETNVANVAATNLHKILCAGSGLPIVWQLCMIYLLYSMKMCMIQEKSMDFFRMVMKLFALKIMSSLPS